VTMAEEKKSGELASILSPHLSCAPWPVGGSMIKLGVTLANGAGSKKRKEEGGLRVVPPSRSFLANRDLLF